MYGLLGSVEDISIEELKAQFETNLFGVISVIQEVLPLMRRQNGGRIINISSIGGIVGYPFNAAYCSTKFALEGLSASMSYEVKQFGIKIVLIEPALVISDFHSNAKIAIKSATSDSAYSQTMQRMFGAYKEVVEKYQIPAEEVAKVILSVVLTHNPEQRYPVGKYSEMMMNAKRTMSDLECHNMMKDQLLSGK